MRITRTAKVKLDITEDSVIPTISAYTKAYNFVCQEGYKKKNFNGVTLHKLTYQTVREYLPSQLAISSRVKATESLASVLKKKKKFTPKVIPRCPQSKFCSIRYDLNSYSLFLNKSECTLLTINGRLRAKLILSDYQRRYLNSWKYTSADLCIKNHKVYLHIVFEQDVADCQHTGKLLGIDRGINNIAVTSDNKFYSGGKVKRICSRYRKLRSGLQKKGSKSNETPTTNPPINIIMNTRTFLCKIRK